ncbi:sugar ABC transporter permease [Georgenia phoenicis]|uniref:carbohydrate ABC transporter permease n=1 Tax=unclassified Georgenia TaxID=2626815 RepID=UPI0039B01F6C
MAITSRPPVEDVTAAGAARPAQRARRRGVNRGWRVTPLLFLIAPVVLLLTFTYYPVASMIWYSFTSWDGIDPVKEWVGLENYTRILTDSRYFRVFVVSAFYLVGALLQMAIALYLATILSFKTRARNLFKGIIFFPYLINGVAIGLIFLYFFRPDGTLDALLGLVGVEDTPMWLGDREWVNVSLAGTSVWRYLGLNFVLFLGAISSIPNEQYEAAELDGANAWQRFRYIIFPGIRQIIGLTAILSVSGALSAFEIPFVMTGGANGSETFVIQTINTAFTFRNTGLASAMAVVLLVIVLIVSWVQRRVFPESRSELT